MLLVIMVLILIIGVVICALANTTQFGDETMELVACIAVGGELLGLVLGAILSAAALTTSGVPERIAIYEEQNQQIEAQMLTIVQSSQEWEKGAFSELKPSDAVMFVQAYPEFKSMELVQQQANLYIENNRQITELKNKGVTHSIIMWWLCFGK